MLRLAIYLAVPGLIIAMLTEQLIPQHGIIGLLALGVLAAIDDAWNGASRREKRELKLAAALRERDAKVCPSCREVIPASAKVCRFCNRPIPGQVESPL